MGKSGLLIESQSSGVCLHHFRLHEGKAIGFGPSKYLKQQVSRHRPATNLRGNPHLNEFTDIGVILITVKSCQTYRLVFEGYERGAI